MITSKCCLIISITGWHLDETLFNLACVLQSDQVIAPTARTKIFWLIYSESNPLALLRISHIVILFRKANILQRGCDDVTKCACSTTHCVLRG